MKTKEIVMLIVGVFIGIVFFNQTKTSASGVATSVSGKFITERNGSTIYVWNISKEQCITYSLDKNTKGSILKQTWKVKSKKE